MPTFVAVEQITIRGGPSAYRFGDKWERACQGKVEHDRWVYLYAVQGEFTAAELRSGLRQVMDMGRAEGWEGIRWERIRADGTVHIAEFKIHPKPDASHLDAGIPNIALK